MCRTLCLLPTAYHYQCFLAPNPDASELRPRPPTYTRSPPPPPTQGMLHEDHSRLRKDFQASPVTFPPPPPSY
jgi:hypothetical protein